MRLVIAVLAECFGPKHQTVFFITIKWICKVLIFMFCWVWSCVSLFCIYWKWAYHLFVSLTSLVSIRFLIHFHLSTHLCHHPHSHHPSLLHSFTPGSKRTFSTNPSHLNRLLLLIGLPSRRWDWTGPITLIILFLVSHFHFFVFFPCGRLSWLPVSFFTAR